VEKLTETTTETTTTTAKPKKKTRRSSKSKPKVAVENKTIDTPTPPKLTEAPQPTEDPKLKELLEKKGTLQSQIDGLKVKMQESQAQLQAEVNLTMKKRIQDKIDQVMGLIQEKEAAMNNTQQELSSLQSK